MRAHISRRTLLARGLAGGAALAAGAGALTAQPGSAAGALFAGYRDYPLPNPALQGERTTLRVWLTPELAAHPAYQTAINLFEHQYPKLRVEVSPVAKDDIPTRLKIAIAGGGGKGSSVVPDLVSHHAYVFGAQGLAQESDFLWAAWGQEGAFLPAAMQDVVWRINTFGIPLVSNAVVTILNAAMFQRAHVPLPTARTTFAQFTQAISAVKRAAGTRYGMILAADLATATSVVHANGGALLRTEAVSGRNLQLLTDRRVVDALRFYTELGWKERLAPLPSEGPSNRLYLAQLFATRQAPAFFGTLSDLTLIQSVDSGIRVAVAGLPGGTTGRTRGSVDDGLSLFVTDPSRHPHAAFELAKWLTARPPALAVAQSLRLAPTVAAYYGDRLFHRDALSTTLFNAARTARPILLDAYAEAADLYRDALRASFGGEDAGRRLAAIARPVQAAMDRADAGIDSDG